MPEAVIVSTARSPIGRAVKGSLKDIRPDDLAARWSPPRWHKVPELDPTDIDDLHPGLRPARRHSRASTWRRVVAVQLGYDFLPGITVNRYCSSSLQTTRMALHAIRAGEGDVFISAGVETVSSFATGNADGLPDTKNPLFADGAGAHAQSSPPAVESPGATPAKKACSPTSTSPWARPPRTSHQLTGITREDQDRWGVRSQNRAEEAIKSRLLRARDHPVTLADGTVVTTDDGPRAGTTYEKISGLKPVFRPDGTVTAGNACPLNDGAAALVIMSDTKAKALGLTPLARIVSTGVTGLSPEIMGLGPIEAVKKALTLAGKSIDDIDLFEINEAFAVQVLGSAASWASTRTSSTSPAAPSPSATRSA